MKTLKNLKFSVKDIILFVIFFILFFCVYMLMIKHICPANDAIEISEISDTGPRTLSQYSEEERQVYAIVMDECVYDIKLKYEAADGEDWYIADPCMYVAKDVVRAIFNPGTLSPEYTIHDVYNESKERVIKVCLDHGTIKAKN